MGGGQIGPCHAAQDAGNDQREIARPGNRHTGAVERLRLLANGAQPQAETGAGQHEGGEENRAERDPDEDVMPRNHLAIDRADDRDAAKLFGKGQLDRPEPFRPREVRRLAALLEHGNADSDRQAGCQNVDGEPADHLVAAQRDRGQPVQKAQHDGDTDCREHAGKRGRCQRRHGRRDKGRHQHLALERDVDHTRLFRKNAGHRAENQRRCHTKGGVDRQQKLEPQISHSARPPCGLSCHAVTAARQAGAPAAC